MAPKRGTARPVRRADRRGEIVIDDDSSGCSQEEGSSCSPEGLHRSNDGGAQSWRQVQNLSTDRGGGPVLQPGSHPRQASPNHHNGSGQSLSLSSHAHNQDTPLRSVERDSSTLTTSKPRHLHQAPNKRAQQPEATSPNPTANDADHDDANMSGGGAYIPSNQQRYMRACMVCSIVRTEQQFKTSGCPNCEHFLELAGAPDMVQECTSQVFDGLLTISDTKKSWVARYQRLEGYVPGVYAVQVEGILSEEVIAAAEAAGVHYVPRDGSVSEALPNTGDA